MRNIILSLLLTFLASSTYADEPTTATNDKIHDALNYLALWADADRAYSQIPGLSMAVAYDGEVIWSKGFGHMDQSRKRPTTAESVYSICSISKLFTAIAIMKLRDEGALDLDDPVAKHLPWFKIKQIHQGSGPVTIRNILSHSSGLPRESDFPYWSLPDFKFPTREEMMERIKDQETLYPSDTYYQYSNLGLSLAGEIVAAVSGVSFEKYVQDQILDPMGLTNTSVQMPEQQVGKKLATGYSGLNRDGKRVEMPFFKANAIAPAAGFASTVEDLAIFAAWQMNVFKGKSNILKNNTLREMQRPHWVNESWDGGRGLGFGVYRFRGATFTGHSGSCPGYRSQVLLQKESKIAVAMAANASMVDTNHYTQNAWALIKHALKNGSGQTKGFDQYTGTYNGQPWDGEAVVFPWEGGLAFAYFPASDPLKAIARLKHIEGNRFRRITDRGVLAEDVVFVMANGKATHMNQGANTMKRMN